MKVKNGYFYSKDKSVLDRLHNELSYAGRMVGRVPGGIVQYARPRPKPSKAEKEKMAEGRTENKKGRPVQRSKRERWMNNG